MDRVGDSLKLTREVYEDGVHLIPLNLFGRDGPGPPCRGRFRVVEEVVQDLSKVGSAISVPRGRLVDSIHPMFQNVVQ